jgi:opacity protein-like surface antigen
MLGNFTSRATGIVAAPASCTGVSTSSYFRTAGSAAIFVAALCTQAYGQQRYESTPQAYQDRVAYDIIAMQSAIDKCDRYAYDLARSDYDFRAPIAPIFKSAPEYPEPCSRKLRTTNIRTPPSTEPVKLYQVGTLRKRAEPTPEERQEIGARIGGPRVEAASFTGFYLGGNVGGNFNWLGQTETFKMTNAITNQFSDSSSAVGGGFNAGLLFSPWNNNILVGPSASIDFLRQDTIHTFPPGPFFLGQTTNVIGTVNGQIGVVATPGLFLYAELGLAVVNVDHKLNFSGPVTSVNQNVTGANVGVGFVFQPANWQVAGIPVAVTGQYNHVFLPGTTFDNPGSPLFLYHNQNDIDRITIGLRAYIDPDAGKRLWRAYH